MAHLSELTMNSRQKAKSSVVCVQFFEEEKKKSISRVIYLSADVIYLYVDTYIWQINQGGKNERDMFQRISVVFKSGLSVSYNYEHTQLHTDTQQHWKLSQSRPFVSGQRGSLMDFTFVQWSQS